MIGLLISDNGLYNKIKLNYTKKHEKKKKESPEYEVITYFCSPPSKQHTLFSTFLTGMNLQGKRGRRESIKNVVCTC